MTGALCIEPVSSVVVVVNANDLDNPNEAGQQRFFSEDLVHHEDFNPNDSSFPNDIGVIRLPSSLIFTPTFQPIRLPSIRQVGQTFANFMSTISGFGSTVAGSNVISNQMHFVRNWIITNLSCRISFPITGILSTQICFSGDGARGACSVR